MKKWLLNALMNVSPGFLIGLIADPFFDMAEEAVKDSSNQWDDRMVLPVIAFLRAYIKTLDKDQAMEAARLKQDEIKALAEASNALTEQPVG